MRAAWLKFVNTLEYTHSTHRPINKQQRDTNCAYGWRTCVALAFHLTVALPAYSFIHLPCVCSFKVRYMPHIRCPALSFCISCVSGGFFFIREGKHNICLCAQRWQHAVWALQASDTVVSHTPQTLPPVYTSLQEMKPWGSEVKRTTRMCAQGSP